MTVLSDFDPAPYTRVPTLDVPSLIALARQILAAAPARPKAPVRQSLGELQDAASALESAYREHLSSPEGLDNRPIDQAADNAWACAYARLDSYAALPAEHHPKARRAQELQKKLFPDGLAFIKLEYGAQWAEAEQRLQLIHKEKLTAELEALIGSEFVAELQRCHALYTEMVGVSQPKKLRKKLPDLRALRLRTQQALSAHSIQLLALHLSGDQKLQDAVRPSFAAIDAYRDKATPEKKKPTPPQPVLPSPPAS
jgi:hypothetical protein